MVEALEAEEAGDEDPNKELIKTIESIDNVKELKKIIKKNDTFKELREGLSGQKNVEALQTKMIVTLNGTEKPAKKADKKAGKKETSKKKASSKKAPGELSNKAKVWQAWDGEETDIAKLFKLTDGGVQEKSIKLWLNKWKKGNGLPAIAKK